MSTPASHTSTASARAVVFTDYGGPKVLQLVDVATPAPGPGELLVAVQAAGVNPVDCKIRAGDFASGPLGGPQRLGFDAAGVVSAVGEGVEGFRVGDAVVCTELSGAYATHVLARADRTWARPTAVSAGQGAALGVPVGTAYQVVRSLSIGPGDTVLLHAGSGAVGQALIQHARLRGAVVVATCSPARAARVAMLGAVPVAYGEGLSSRVRAAAPGGLTVAVDAAGTDEAVATSLEMVDDRSRIATLVRGAEAAALGIHAFAGGTPTPLSEQQLAWRAEAMPVTLALMAAGAFRVEIGDSFELGEASAAHAAFEKGEAGKVLLVV